MDRLSPLLAIAPQPGFDHPQPQYLTAEHDPMSLTQLLGRQGRAEISQYHSRVIASTASGSRRLLRRPRRFEIRPVAP